MRHVFERLEPRRLLSHKSVGDLNLDGSITNDDYDYGPGLILNWTDFSGTAKNDVIVVSATYDAVKVSVNGSATYTDAGKLEIFAGAGNDKIHIDLPDSYAHWLITIHGGAGNDLIVGSMAAERVMAGDGDDTVRGNGGRDTIYGEGGNDSVRGGGSSDFLDGGAGDDTLRGDAGNDRIAGGDGFDRLRGSLGNDSLAGGASKDFIGGEVGNDQLEGDGGADVLAGGEDDDVVIGGAGDDNASGNHGDDFLSGGSGIDLLFGGGGNDGFDPSETAPEARDLEAADLEPGLTAVTVANTVAVSRSRGLTNVGTGTLVFTGSNTYSGSIAVNAAQLDLTNNSLMIVNNVAGAATYGGVQGLVQSASDSGAWSGGAITAAPAAPGALTTIGIASGAQAGQTITASSVLAMYTYAGDTNLDGVVDASDWYEPSDARLGATRSQ